MSAEKIEAMVAEEDPVAYRWTMAGTDPRTGDRRSWRGMSIVKWLQDRHQQSEAQ